MLNIAGATPVADVELKPYKMEGQVEIYRVKDIEKYVFHDTKPLNEQVRSSKMEQFLKENCIPLDVNSKKTVDAAVYAVMHNRSRVAMLNLQ